jgi:hypothetical protein
MLLNALLGDTDIVSDGEVNERSARTTGMSPNGSIPFQFFSLSSQFIKSAIKTSKCAETTQDAMWRTLHSIRYTLTRGPGVWIWGKEKVSIFE